MAFMGSFVQHFMPVLLKLISITEAYYMEGSQEHELVALKVIILFRNERKWLN